MPGFKITPRAQDDLKNIGRYTLKAWGKVQRDKYLREMATRFEWLSSRPKIGRLREDVGEGYYCFSQGSHLIFYMIFDDFISIIGIVHQDMDVVNYFSAAEKG